MSVRRSTFFIDSPLPAQAPAFRRALLRWYRKAGRDLPWRRTRDPYAITVSELMLQQTQVATVIPYYKRWLGRFPDFASLAAADESDVLHAWQGLGYYARARNLHAAAKIVATAYGGALPPSASAIQKLPGFGRYTANAVATFAFDQSVPIVEANTARSLARLSNLQTRIDSSEGQSQLWYLAASLLPTRSARIYNSALTDLGALVCVSGQPRCDICPVRLFCSAENPATLPRKKSRTPLVELTEHHHFSTDNGHVLLEQSHDRWRGMWILPRIDPPPPATQPLHSSAFPFTHHRVTLHVYATKTHEQLRDSQRWFERDGLASIPMPSPHRRALHSLLGNAQLNVGR